MFILLNSSEEKISDTPKESQTFPELCLDGEGADLEIVVDDGKFMVHKSVLFRNSPALEKLPQLPLILKTIKFTPISYKTLKVIFQAFYSGKLENFHILDMSEQMRCLNTLLIFGNKEFLDSCLREMIEKIKVENCIVLLKYAVSCNLANHKKICLEYIGRHFPRVIKLDSYRSLSYEEILNIFSKIELVAEPHEMYFGINNWLLSAPDNWASYARELLYICNRVLRRRESYIPEFPWENSFFVSQCSDDDILSCFDLISKVYSLRTLHGNISIDEGYNEEGF